MAYTKQTWVDNTTPVDAEHLNHMESGISANADDITTLNADLTDLKPQSVRTSGTTLSDYMDYGIYYFGSSQTPTDSPSGTNGWLINITGSSTSIRKQIWMRLGTPGTNDYNTFIRTINGETIGQWWQVAIVGVNTTSLSTSDTGEPVVMGEDETVEDA